MANFKIVAIFLLFYLNLKTDFDSPFEFEPAKFYCTIFKRGGNSTLFLL
jgi:hypothetical protein